VLAAAKSVFKDYLYPQKNLGISEKFFIPYGKRTYKLWPEK